MISLINVRQSFQVPEEKIDDTKGIIRSVDFFCLIVIFKTIKKSLKYMEMFNNYI